MDRRQALQRIGYGTLGLSVGAAAGLVALAPPQEEPPLCLGSIGELAMQGVRVFPEHGIALLRVEQGLAFLQMRCTHLGCAVRLVGERWICPCHGGAYSREGDVLAGPPPRGLTWLAGEVSTQGLIYCYPSREQRKKRYAPVLG